MFTTRLTLGTVCIALTLGGVAARADKSAIWAYRELLESSDFAKAQPLLSQSLRQTGLAEEDEWRLRLDLAKTQRYQGKASAALRTLRDVKQSDAGRSAVRVEQAWSMLLTKQQREAIPMLEVIRGESDIEPAFIATYLLAQLSFEQERFEPCSDLCQQAIRMSKKLDFYHNPNAWELRRVQAEVYRLAEEVKHRKVARQFGDDYAYYRRGRLAQAARRYDQAIEAYSKVKAPVLVDAAGCYIGQCLAAKGEAETAVKQWQAMLSADELGLYRGEAILEIGKLQLLNAMSRSNMKGAEVSLKRAIAWCQQVAKQTPKATVESIKEVLKAFPIPESAATQDRFGNFHRAHAGPETVTNRLTSTWYLNDLQMRAMLLHAFALHQLNDRGAKGAMERLIAFNRKHNSALLDMGDAPKQLIDDSKDGAFIVPPGAWRMISASRAAKLQLACYLTVAGDIDWARQLFEEVYIATNGRTEDMLDWSTAEYGLACVAFRQNNLPGAIDRLGRFETVLRDSPLTPLAMLLAANLYAGQTDGWTEASQRYTWVVRQTAETPLGPRALLSMAIAAANCDENSIAAEACEAMIQKYEDSKYTPAARALLARVKGVRLQAARRSSKRRESVGRVIPFERHLIIPGSVDFTLNVAQFSKNDLLDYQIGYAVRSGCQLSNFWYRLSLNEPQPPPTLRSPLQFFRAPALALAD